MLTERQKQVLDFIIDWIAEHDYSPSVREICDAFDFQLNACEGHLRALERKGAIRRIPGTARSISVIGYADSDTRKYTLKVLAAEGNDTKTFSVHSPIEIDERVLQLVGLILDGGCNPDVIRSEVPTAEAYVFVESGNPPHESWVDKALSGH